LDLLTDRERAVVILVALGHTNMEVGRRLHISAKTVETDRKNSMVRLNLKTRAEFFCLTLDHEFIGV
jgi:two-component system response regulator NreC